MKLLSCAGTRANLRDIIRDYDRLGDGVWDIFNASKDSVAWYYTSMLDAFGNGDEGIRDMPAFQEFEKCVGEMFEDGGGVGVWDLKMGLCWEVPEPVKIYYLCDKSVLYIFLHSLLPPFLHLTNCHFFCTDNLCPLCTL